MLREIKNKDIILCILSGILLSLSFSSFNLGCLAWFGFVPLFFALQNKSKGKAFLLGFLTGIIFWLGTIYWLVHVTLIGTLILVIYLALYFGVFSLIIKAYSLKLTAYSLLLVPSIWVLLEYLRSYLLTGFPWALLAYSQYKNLPVIQIVDVFGAWGVSFLVMMVNVGLYQVIGDRFLVLGKKKRVLNIIFCLSVFIAVTIYGFYKLNLAPNTQHLTPIEISVIQGNIPQEMKWNAETSDFIINKYIALSSKAAKDNPDLLIWPEASLPVVLEEEPDYFKEVKRFAQRTSLPLLLGAVTTGNDLYFNSAIFVSGEGAELARYNKLHLVPFGEYIPLKNTFPFLETIAPIGDITPGREYTIFKNKAEFAALICFEDLFPEISRVFVQNGAKLLVNITNDAWYKHTSAPYQHLAASVFRAVENRVNLVRAANTGISGFISPDGTVVTIKDNSGKEIFVDGYKMHSVKIGSRYFTIYTKFGDIFIFFLFIFVICCIFI